MEPIDEAFSTSTEPRISVDTQDKNLLSVITENRISDVSSDRLSVVTENKRSDVSSVISELNQIGDDNKQEIMDLLSSVSPSIAEVMAETEPPFDPASIETVAVFVDLENEGLNKAIHEIRRTFTEENVQSELTKIYDMYKESQQKNSRIVKQNKYLTRKLERLQEAVENDPRILKVLRIAEGYRRKLTLDADINVALEMQKFELSNELKRVEEQIQKRDSHIVHLQNKCKKMKEMERQREVMEKLIIQKDNELNNLKEKSKPKVLEEQGKGEREQLAAKMANAELKRQTLERDWANKLQKVKNEKTELTAELDIREKTVQKLRKVIYNNSRELKAIHKTKNYYVQSYKSMRTKANLYLSRNKTMKREKTRLLIKIANLEMLVKKGNDSLDACFTKTSNVSADMTKQKYYNVRLRNKLRVSQERLITLETELGTWKEKHNVLRNENVHYKKSLKEFEVTSRHKETELTSIRVRYNKLNNVYGRNLKMMQMVYQSAMFLNKEISGLNNENMKLFRSKKELKMQIDAINTFLNQIIEDYHESEHQNRTLQRENQKNLSTIAKDEKDRMEKQRKIVTLQRTNIDFHNTTTSQAEVEVMLRNQFEQMKKECFSLNSAVVDKTKKVEILQEQEEERLMHIGQLNAKIKNLEERKAAIKEQNHLMALDVTHLKEQLQQANVLLAGAQRDATLLRYQRDLFGSKLLQKKTELDIVSERQKLAEVTIKKGNLDYQNLKNDVRILKLEVKNLRRKLYVSVNKSTFTSQLKAELINVNKSLQVEKEKVATTESPNISHLHPWREMSYRDPSKYELVLEIHKLTRLLVRKTCESTEKEELIKQKDYHFLQLRTLVMRRSDPNLSSEMSLAKATIRKQNKQLKALTAELNLKIEELRRNRETVENQKQMLDEMKREETRRKRQNLIQSKRKENEKTTVPQQPKLVLPSIHSKPLAGGSLRPLPSRHFRK